MLFVEGKENNSAVASMEFILLSVCFSETFCPPAPTFFIRTSVLNEECCLNVQGHEIWRYTERRGHIAEPGVSID